MTKKWNEGAEMKKVITLVLVILIVLSMTACSTSPGSKNYEEHTNNRLIQTRVDKNLYYDPNTKIVYIIFNEAIGYKGYGYMSPYYANNGLPYVYNVERNCLEEIDE